MKTIFSIPIRVYYEDTDAGGVVYYANYLRFMERARTEWLRHLGFEQDELARDPGVLFAVRSAKLEFLKPARFNEVLEGNGRHSRTRPREPDLPAADANVTHQTTGRANAASRDPFPPPSPRSDRRHPVRRRDPRRLSRCGKFRAVSDSARYPFPTRRWSPDVNLTTSSDGVAILSMMLNASLPVQLVLLLLVLASITSWTMIFRKWFVFKLAAREAERFEQKFWSGGNVGQMYTELSRDEAKQTGMASVFVEGFREYKRLASQSNIEPMDILEGVQRAMRVALSREINYLETHLSFLATVGSTSPYVGLFGTVWGIMNSFRSLGSISQPTIAHVAPGIAEALVATAIGLFAAIPAVIAYNRYANNVERLVARYEIFMEEFASILQRQAFAARA